MSQHSYISQSAGCEVLVLYPWHPHANVVGRVDWGGNEIPPTYSFVHVPDIGSRSFGCRISYIILSSMLAKAILHGMEGTLG